MAAPQQYSLRWNNYSQHIVNALDDLRSDDELTDVTLSCEGQRIKAHKILLSACSNYFRETFRENPCKHPIVILKGVNIADLRAVVTFMYNGQVNVSQDRLQSFLHTAELLQIKGLTDMNDKDEPPKKRPVNNTSSLHNNQDSSRLSSGDGAARPPTPKRKRPVQPGFANETSAASPSTNNSASAGGSNGVGPSTSNSGLITADGVVVPTITSVTSNASTSSNHSQNNMTQDDSYPNIGVVKFEDDDMQDEDDYEDKILSSEDNDNSVQDMLQVDQSGIGSFMGASGGQPGLSSATESSSHGEDEDEMDSWNGLPPLDPSRFQLPDYFSSSASPTNCTSTNTTSNPPAIWRSSSAIVKNGKSLLPENRLNPLSHISTTSSSFPNSPSSSVSSGGTGSRVPRASNRQSNMPMMIPEPIVTLQVDDELDEMGMSGDGVSGAGRGGRPSSLTDDGSAECHICDICDKSFTLRTNLNAHKRIHTGETKCPFPFCDRVLSTVGNLRSHMLAVHPGLPSPYPPPRKYNSSKSNKQIQYLDAEALGQGQGGLMSENTSGVGEEDEYEEEY